MGNMPVPHPQMIMTLPPMSITAGGPERMSELADMEEICEMLTAGHDRAGASVTSQ